VSLAVTDMPREPGKGGKNAVSPTGVARIFDATAPDYVYIEDVWSSPQMGVVSAFSFGRNLGILEGAGASRAFVTKVRPQDWKTATKTPKDKNEARRRAMQLFPCAYDLFVRVKDDGRAEAALLGFYGLLSMKLIPPKPLSLVEFPS
jgi:crossover junction endodeoxyribonuclease RuvC